MSLQNYAEVVEYLKNNSKIFSYNALNAFIQSLNNKVLTKLCLPRQKPRRSALPLL